MENTSRLTDALAEREGTEMYPYFQARWRKGKATHVVEVYVSDDEFDDLVQQGFGVTSEEYFSDDYIDEYNRPKKAKELYKFLVSKNVDMAITTVR